MCLKLRAEYCFYSFLIVFDAFSPNGVKTQFGFHETWHTTLFGKYYCGEMVRILIDIIENNSDMP